MEMLDRIIYKFLGWIDNLNKKVNDVLTFEFPNCKKSVKKKNLEQK